MRSNGKPKINILAQTYILEKRQNTQIGQYITSPIVWENEKGQIVFRWGSDLSLKSNFLVEISPFFDFGG